MVSRQRQRQAGFTLIELMIAILVGTFLIGGVIAVFMGTYRSNVEDLRITHLNQELRGTMALITRDLKRAGYDSDAIQNVISNNLPISAFTELNT
ncbi:MAG: prepilin-type N-terminal cleavage/methylation domain-containing protein [Gammaproteobacteria bacterium]|nr:prepilin-type N-terminal cleavage/methylation domain-containing protein [Gammaproteobacteria bacterium]